MTTKRSTIGKAFAAGISVAIISASASAGTISIEHFSYTPGQNLIGQSNSDGGYWEQAGDDATLTNQPVVIAGNITYPGLTNATGNEVQLGGLARPNGLAARYVLPTSVSSGTLYASFIFQIDDITGLTANGYYWIAFNNASGTTTTFPSGAYARFAAKPDTGDPTKFVLGIVKNSTGSYSYDTNAYSTGTPIFMVISYQFNSGGSSDDVVKAWINPDPATFGAGSEPPATLTNNVGTDISSIVSFILCNRHSGMAKVRSFDELNFGTEWADVTMGAGSTLSLDTQPASQRLLVGQTIQLDVSSPDATSYQWQWNGNPIAGATNPGLVISNAQVADSGNYTVIVSNPPLSLVSSAAVVTVLRDVFPRLAPLWGIAPSIMDVVTNRPYITSDIGSRPEQRCIAYYPPLNHLYLVSRTNIVTGSGDPAIWVLDGTTGEELYQMNTDPGIIFGGANNLTLNSIAVADDGAIYACNTDVAESFRLYRWANDDSNTVPVAIWGGTPPSMASERLGDALDARGSGINTEIIADSYEGNWAALFRPASADLDSFWLNTVAFANHYANSSIGRSLAFGTNNTYWAHREGGPIVLAQYDVNTFNSTNLASYPDWSPDVVPLAFDFQKSLGAGIENPRTDTVPDPLRLYEISDLNLPMLLAEYSFPTNHWNNGYMIGKIIWAEDKVFALSANNGLAAFSILPYRPTLNISLSGADVVLSWPTNAVGYTVESTTDISSSTWTSEGAGTVQGEDYVLTNQVGGIKFYRLVK